MIRIETRRLLLREFNEEDAPHMVVLNSDPDVLRYTGDKPFRSIDDAYELIRNYSQYKTHQRGRLSMFLKETGEYVGWCGLKYHTEDGETDLGYRLMKRYWNMGYASEAAQACIDYGFRELKLPSIVGHAMKANTASIRVFEKTRMHFEKEDTFEGEAIVFYRIFNPHQTS